MSIVQLLHRKPSSQHACDCQQCGALHSWGAAVARAGDLACSGLFLSGRLCGAGRLFAGIRFIALGRCGLFRINILERHACHGRVLSLLVECTVIGFHQLDGEIS